MKRGSWVLLLALLGCTERGKSSAPLQKPVPLEPLIAERVATDGAEASYTVKVFTFAGDSVPAGALRLEVAGERVKVAGQPSSLAALEPQLTAGRVVVLGFDAETYLAQVTGLFALLDDRGAQVWLQSPDLPDLAWPVRLRDEANFSGWLDEPVAGKLRIVHRADGFELQTNMGKLAGGDPKGPTVPTRGGALDLATLQKGLDRVKRRFIEAPDVCFMPSYGTALHDATRALATNWITREQVVFSGVCLVYPRPSESGRTHADGG